MDRVTNGRFGKFHTLELVVIARIKSAVMLEHETFKLPSGDRYRLAGFSFLEWVAFCHINFVSFRGCALWAVFYGGFIVAL